MTFIDAARAAVGQKSGEDLVRAVADLLAAERSRAVDICRSRAGLWRRTPSASSAVAAAREEARARANEAAYLADVIELGEVDAAPAN